MKQLFIYILTLVVVIGIFVGGFFAFKHYCPKYYSSLKSGFEEIKEEIFDKEENASIEIQESSSSSSSSSSSADNNSMWGAGGGNNTSGGIIEYNEEEISSVVIQESSSSSSSSVVNSVTAY